MESSARAQAPRGGLAAVLAGGLVTASLRDWVWLGAILLDLAAAVVSGHRNPARVHAGHFAERHGLIVIVALGESLIVAGRFAGGIAALAGTAAGRPGWRVG
jgi:low temperature requirement protein LtrA